MVSIDDFFANYSHSLSRGQLKVFSTIIEVKHCLKSLKNGARTIGFVPTMGALHQGHISLLEGAKKENDVSVASIFVNPLQFNDKKDLEKYPRTLKEDLEKLRKAGCDIVFVPTVEEMYPSYTNLTPNPSPLGEGSLSSPTRMQVSPEGTTAGWERSSSEGSFDLGTLDTVMEGIHRPGHFQGVCVVVKKLFDIIEPDKAYFGEKDFQQVAVIKHMVNTLKLPVKVIPCPTLRETDGLAMSSRNALLNTDERKSAPLIYKTMMDAKRLAAEKNYSLQEVQQFVREKIEGSPFLKLEYFEVVASGSLLPVTEWKAAGHEKLRACIAVKAGSVRLIDNISF